MPGATPDMSFSSSIHSIVSKKKKKNPPIPIKTKDRLTKADVAWIFRQHPVTKITQAYTSFLLNFPSKIQAQAAVRDMRFGLVSPGTIPESTATSGSTTATATATGTNNLRFFLKLQHYNNLVNMESVEEWLGREGGLEEEVEQEQEQEQEQDLKALAQQVSERSESFFEM